MHRHRVPDPNGGHHHDCCTNLDSTRALNRLGTVAKCPARGGAGVGEFLELSRVLWLVRLKRIRSTVSVQQDPTRTHSAKSIQQSVGKSFPCSGGQVASKPTRLFYLHYLHIFTKGLKWSTDCNK